MTPIQILLVDAETNDAAEVRWSLDKLRVHYRLTHVRNAQDAIRDLQKQDLERSLPYIMLIDLDLPDANGTALLTEIQNNPAWKKIKCFLLSKSGKRPDKKETAHLSIAGFISKPFQLTNSLSMDSLNLVIDLVNYKAAD